MGARGPIPNREDDLARPRARKGGDQQETVKGVLKPVDIPEPDPEWHPIAVMLWNALADSGQADFYQQSDWAFAYSLCDDLSSYKLKGRGNGQVLATLYGAMGDLLVTEGHRRRVRMELVSPQPEKTPASVTAISDYRASLGLPAEETSA